MMNNFAFDISTIQYPCDLYIGNELTAKINNEKGFKEVVNILLMRGVKKEDIAIEEYEYVEFEEIIEK